MVHVVKVLVQNSPQDAKVFGACGASLPHGCRGAESIPYERPDLISLILAPIHVKLGIRRLKLVSHVTCYLTAALLGRKINAPDEPNDIYACV